MKPQLDYEIDPTLAVFSSAAHAEQAAGELQKLGIARGAVHQLPLRPGTYQLVDHSLGQEWAGITRGAEFGLPAGAALGLGVAATLGGGSAPEMLAGFAASGAAVGALVGALEGAAMRAHYDDDVAQTIELPDGTEAVLLVVQTRSDGTTGRARNALRTAGALGFLDPECYPLDDTE
jgi:hypothetical protein